MGSQNPLSVKKERDRVSVMVSMAQWQKDRFTAAAQEQGMTFSGFLRVAAEEYIKNHNREEADR